MASCHFVRVANKILNVNRGFTRILLARMMHSHHDGTSMCHTPTRKMPQTLHLWSALNVYLKQMCSILSLLCIFQGRLVHPEKWLPAILSSVANKILNVNRGFTRILLARMMHSHHDGTSMCHTPTRKMPQTLHLWSALNVYLKQMCSILSLLCIFQG